MSTTVMINGQERALPGNRRHTETVEGVPVLQSCGDDLMLSPDGTDEQLDAARAIGYVNAYRVDVFEYLNTLRQRLPAGWQVTAQSFGYLPDMWNPVRVGQIRVRSGDHDMPVYIYQQSEQPAPPVRNQVIRLRCTTAERDAIARHAQEAGQTISEYLRCRAL